MNSTTKLAPVTLVRVVAYKTGKDVLRLDPRRPSVANRQAMTLIKLGWFVLVELAS